MASLLRVAKHQGRLLKRGPFPRMVSPFVSSFVPSEDLKRSALGRPAAPRRRGAGRCFRIGARSLRRASQVERWNRPAASQTKAPDGQSDEGSCLNAPLQTCFHCLSFFAVSCGNLHCLSFWNKNLPDVFSLETFFSVSLVLQVIVFFPFVLGLIVRSRVRF